MSPFDAIANKQLLSALGLSVELSGGDTLERSSSLVHNLCGEGLGHHLKLPGTNLLTPPPERSRTQHHPCDSSMRQHSDCLWVSEKLKEAVPASRKRVRDNDEDSESDAIHTPKRRRSWMEVVMGPSPPDTPGSEGTLDSPSPHGPLLDPSLARPLLMFVEDSSEDNEEQPKTETDSEDDEWCDDDEYVVVDDQRLQGAEVTDDEDEGCISPTWDIDTFDPDHDDL